MRENPLENTFYQFIVLTGLFGGLFLIVLGIATSQPGRTLMGILFFLIGLSFVASFVYKYRRIRP